MRADLIEPFCGSAPFSLHALGARRYGIVPYHGNKWKFRHVFVQLLAERGITALDPVLLNDLGPWGRTWRVLLDPASLTFTCNILCSYAKEDPLQVYQRLHRGPVPPDEGRANDDWLFAAQHLFLERLAFSGKAVGIRNGEWRSSGFNKTSANGSNREGFGKIHPMVPRLVKRLEDLASELDWARIQQRHLPGEDTSSRITISQANACTLEIKPRGPTVIYMDPNYRNTTGYPNGSISRPDLVDLALKSTNDETLVMVSEGEPISELVDHGWETVQIAGPVAAKSPFKTKKPEWVTLTCPW